MMIAAGINIALDPLLIFGVWILPEMGVAGAALATVISRFITLLVALYVLIVREKLIAIAGISGCAVEKLVLRAYCTWGSRAR